MQYPPCCHTLTVRIRYNNEKLQIKILNENIIKNPNFATSYEPVAN